MLLGKPKEKPGTKISKSDIKDQKNTQKTTQTKKKQGKKPYVSKYIW